MGLNLGTKTKNKKGVILRDEGSIIIPLIDQFTLISHTIDKVRVLLKKW